MMTNARADAPPAPDAARLTIDLAALKANWRTLDRFAAPGSCAAVVKADAYGLGITRAVPALWEAGARDFFVAHLAEAEHVRAAAPEANIWLLNGLQPGLASALRALDVRPVLGSWPEIEEWTASGGGPAALHVDTGMNRLGLTLEDAAEAGSRFVCGTLGFTPALIMTHAATADEDAHPLTPLQVDRFRAVRTLFPKVPASLANSAASLTAAIDRFDLCRPGIALYGGTARGARPETKPVVSLHAPVLQVREVPAGEGVGYGAAEFTKRASRIAILNIGYADGIPRAAGSSEARAGASVVLAGQRCPLFGRISMDLTAVDVTHLPEGAVKRGDLAEVLGHTIGVDELAAHAGTIGYEILTSLGKRYQRIYRTD